MATFKTDLITKQEAALTGLSGGVLQGDDANGELRLATGIVTVTDALAGDDILAICDLPPGAVPVPQLSHATCANPGTALVIDVGYTDAPEGGDNADEDGLADGITMSAGGQFAFTGGTLPATVAAPFRTERKTRVQALVKTATSITDATKIAFTIAYRVKG